MISSFFEFNKTTRKWHLPFVAGLTVGIPLIVGWAIDNIEAGKLASLAGLSILYIQSENLVERMMLLMTCCFGLMISFTIGLFFSFNNIVGTFTLGIFSFGVHYSLHKLKLTKPPGNFFFIMLASTAICTPFDIHSIPTKIGYIAIGTILTCGIALVYSLLTIHEDSTIIIPNRNKDLNTNIVESMIFGLFMSISLGVAFLMELENPYWIPISCAAVMQGSNSGVTWLRGIQRIVGTLIGLGITWIIIHSNPTTFGMVISIIVLQIIIEFLVVRNYAVTVVFITILTIFLSESGEYLSQDTNNVFLARLFDILIGSTIGIIGGWALFDEKIHYYSKVPLRKIAVNKNRKLRN